MIKPIEPHYKLKGETYHIITDYETGTVNGLIKLLTEVQEAGYGDKRVIIGYDSNLAFTIIEPYFMIEDDEIIFLEDMDE